MMSAARFTAARLARTSSTVLASRRYFHSPVDYAGGLLQRQTPLVARTSPKRTWPFNTNALHNAPATRAISFARVLPNLAVKFLRIPAMFGAATIGGLAYLQYQATRKVTTVYLTVC